MWSEGDNAKDQALDSGLLSLRGRTVLAWGSCRDSMEVLKLRAFLIPISLGRGGNIVVSVVMGSRDCGLQVPHRKLRLSGMRSSLGLGSAAPPKCLGPPSGDLKRPQGLRRGWPSWIIQRLV